MIDFSGEVIEFHDHGRRLDGKFLSVFKLKNGKIIKSVYGGMIPEIRMMKDSISLFYGGVSKSDINKLGIPKFTIDMAIDKYGEFTTA